MKSTMKKTFGSLTAKFAALLLAFGLGQTAWGVTTQVASQADLTTAVAAAAAGDTVQVTAAGTYTLGNIPRAITIEGAVSGVTLDYSSLAYGQSFGKAATGTMFKSIDFTMGTADYRGWQHSSGISFENCTFTGKFFSYGDMTFTNCTFTQTDNDYHMWIYSSGKVSYIGCTFNYIKKCLHVYTDQNDGHKWDVYCSNCTFNPANAADSGNKGVLNVKNTSFSPASVDIILNDCTTTNEKGLVQLESNATDGNTAVAIGSDIVLDASGDIVSGNFTTLYTGSTADSIIATGSAITDNGNGTFSVAVDPYAAYTKVADGFYRSGATYTASTDFYITSKAGLEYFRDLVNQVGTVADTYVTTYVNSSWPTANWYTGNIFSGKTVHLMTDVDLNNVEWSPIGQPTNANGDKRRFYGHFNGENHTISNLKTTQYVETAKTWYPGLFGAIGPTTGQTFSNLTLHNVTAVGYDYAGALIGNAGSNNINVNNCHLTGVISITSVAAGDVGGFVGIGCPSFTNCTVDGDAGSTISGGVVGGLVGTGSRGKATSITGCTVEDVTITSSANGAIVGGLSGRANAAMTVEGNTVQNVTVSAENGKADALVAGNVTNVSASSNTTDTNVTVISDPITGSGTAEDPYIIPNLDALKVFRDRVNSGTS